MGGGDEFLCPGLTLWDIGNVIPWVIQEKNLGIKEQSRVFGIQLDRRNSQHSQHPLNLCPSQEMQDHIPKREGRVFPANPGAGMIPRLPGAVRRRSHGSTSGMGIPWESEIPWEWEQLL